MTGESVRTFFSWTGRLSTRRQLVELVRCTGVWVVSRRQVLKGHSLSIVVLVIEAALLLLSGISSRSTTLRELTAVLLRETTLLLWCSVAGLRVSTEVALRPKVAWSTAVRLPLVVALTTALRWLVVALVEALVGLLLAVALVVALLTLVEATGRRIVLHGIARCSRVLLGGVVGGFT